jgi:hypothetical protein
MVVGMMRDDATIRYRLRLARTSVQVRTPGKEARKRIFSAALQQFEELITAADAVGPASRPLPLFYALSQAGRAITAAHGSAPWELRGHGLEMPGPSAPTSLLERTVEPRPAKADSFHRVADTIGSAQLTGPVELGALWASLPYDLPKAWRQKWPRVLSLGPERQGSTLVLSQEARAQVAGFTFPALTADAVRDALQHYPTANGWFLQGGGQPIGLKSDFGWHVKLAWTANGSSEDDRMARLAEVAPEYRYSGHHWLRPAVGAQKDYLHPLVTWWALLFGLSIVARYEPGTWARELAIDSSDLAANLESLLGDALLAIPQLVLEALETKPFLVTR